MWLDAVVGGANLEALMKSKKALKRLGKVDALLSDVLSEYSPIEKELRASLSSAKTSLASARKLIGQRIAAEAADKQTAKPKETPQAAAAAKNSKPAAASLLKAPTKKPKHRPKAAAKKSRPRATKAKLHSHGEGADRVEPVMTVPVDNVSPGQDADFDTAMPVETH